MRYFEIMKYKKSNGLHGEEEMRNLTYEEPCHIFVIISIQKYTFHDFLFLKLNSMLSFFSLITSLICS